MKYKNLFNFIFIFKILLIFAFIFLLSSIIFFCVNIWDKNTNKFTLNKYFPTKNRLKTFVFDKNNLPDIPYPYILKPTVCSGGSKNVYLINNDKDLYNFIKTKPDDKYIVQEFYKSKNEIGVLYEKIPHINDGNVISVVMKKKENNINEWKPLNTCGDIKNNEYINCEDLTSYLNNSNFNTIIKNISSGILGLNTGRYDIGFENVDDLNNGEFKIYELNGVMGYDLRFVITDNDNIYDTIVKAYYLVRWIGIRYLIGFINIISLKVSPFYIIDTYINSISNTMKCSDWEHLFQPSPA